MILLDREDLKGLRRVPGQIDFGDREVVGGIRGQSPTQFLVDTMKDQLSEGTLKPGDLVEIVNRFDRSEVKRRGEGAWLNILARIEDMAPSDNNLVDTWYSLVARRTLVEVKQLNREEGGIRGTQIYRTDSDQPTKDYYDLVRASELAWEKIEIFGVQAKIDTRWHTARAKKRLAGEPGRVEQALGYAYDTLVNSKLAKGVGRTALLSAIIAAEAACSVVTITPPVLATEIQATSTAVPTSAPEATKSPEPTATREPAKIIVPEEIVVAKATEVPQGLEEWYANSGSLIEPWKVIWAEWGIIWNQPTAPGEAESSTLQDHIVRGVDGAENMLCLAAIGDNLPDGYVGMALCIPPDLSKGGFSAPPQSGTSVDAARGKYPTFVDIAALEKDGLELATNGETYLAVRKGTEPPVVVRYLDNTGNWQQGKPTAEAPAPTATKEVVVYDFELGKQLPATVEEVGVVGLQAPDPLDEPEEFAKFKALRDAWAKSPGNCDSAIYHKASSGVDAEGVMGYVPEGFEKGNGSYHDTAVCGYWFEHGGKNYQVITIPFDWGHIRYTDILLQDGPTRTLAEQLAWIKGKKVGFVYFVRHSGGYTSRTDISFDPVWRQLAIKFADDFDKIDPYGQGDPNSPSILVFAGYADGY